ncbi:MAG: hypothetical protein GJ676_07385 [Rhodobacteraceae bacterium]|nr:hypothetical protein [Paracoccaceae bacterium]
MGKFICIDLTYSGHVAAAGLEMPAEPVIIAKTTRALCDPTTRSVSPGAPRNPIRANRVRTTELRWVPTIPGIQRLDVEQG